jgi:hypothetical protein
MDGMAPLFWVLWWDDTRVHGGAKLLTSWWVRSKERERKELSPNIPFEDTLPPNNLPSFHKVLSPKSSNSSWYHHSLVTKCLAYGLWRTLETQTIITALNASIICSLWLLGNFILYGFTRSSVIRNLGCFQFEWSQIIHCRSLCVVTNFLNIYFNNFLLYFEPLYCFSHISTWHVSLGYKFMLNNFVKYYQSAGVW